ncbi:MAG: hypothetical protein M3308_04640, partial [Actinomycetota bacterium]|nr:hypothetical protein [Actinomycetota bacterium]
MTYTEQLNEMEAEIMRLGALRNHQVEDSDNWWSYQHRITELTNRMLALEASVPQLEAADREIRYADWIVQQAQQRADHDMDLLWRVAKVFGLAGLLGLVISVLWVAT